jgi:hypothetical protein
MYPIYWVSWPYLEILDKPEKIVRNKHSSLLCLSVNVLKTHISLSCTLMYPVYWVSWPYLEILDKPEKYWQEQTL